MLFQLRAYLFKVLETLGHGLLHVGNVLGRAHACHDILALGINQVFPVENLLAIGWVAGKGYPGGAGITGIAEYHGLYGDGGTPTRREYHIAGDR